MKRFAYLITVTVLATGLSFAQTQAPANQNAKPAQGQQQQQQPPAAGQAPATGQAPAAGQTAEAPAGKRQPQAKSKPEYDAYVALMQMTDPAAMEKAAGDFVGKFPDSELKGAVYQRTMAAYQNSGNEEKTLEMGQKSLSFNPDDPGVLVSIGELIASRTRETDLDKDQRLAEATKDAKHALETVTDYPAPPQMPPEQVATIKNEMRGTAYSVLGMAAYTNKNYPEAIENFKQAIDVTKENPDPTVYLRYTLALDKAGRYPEALEAANKTLALQGVPPQVTQLATQEKNRLDKLVNAPKPAAPAAPASPQPQPVQPH
ncbi:MAG: hypothetical protein ACM3JB_28480 [Acidobacteriaceae bacterium]